MKNVWVAKSLEKIGTASPWSGLRFDKEIKIIFKYRDCQKVLRIVICKYIRFGGGLDVEF